MGVGGPRFCISNKPPGEADSTDSQNTLGLGRSESWLKQADKGKALFIL